jgi:V8-like Glu-specific endopeptidase
MSAQAVRNGYNTTLPDNVVTLKVFGTNYCTGLRISQNYIITAAHCMKNTKSRRKYGKVIIKFSDKKITYTYKTNTKFATIKSFKNSSEIAVLRIDSKNLDFKASAISQEPNELYLRNYKFYGYGYTQKKGPGTLRYGFLNSIGTSVSSGFTLLKMGPGNENHHPCPGDSGGPLFTNTGKAIGIVSFINHSKKSIKDNTAKEQCGIANRSYFVYLNEHLEFLKPYL